LVLNPARPFFLVLKPLIFGSSPHIFGLKPLFFGHMPPIFGLLSLSLKPLIFGRIKQSGPPVNVLILTESPRPCILEAETQTLNGKRWVVSLRRGRACLNTEGVGAGNSAIRPMPPWLKATRHFALVSALGCVRSYGLQRLLGEAPGGTEAVTIWPLKPGKKNRKGPLFPGGTGRKQKSSPGLSGNMRGLTSAYPIWVGLWDSAEIGGRIWPEICGHIARPLEYDQKTG